MPYVGFLYAGLMIDKSGNPKTLEFNCRLGDPETQPIMLRLKSDLLELVEHALDGTLDQVEAEWDRRSALGVVLAAARLPRRAAQGRRDHRPAQAHGGLPRVPRRHTLEGKRRRHQRRPRALRHRARRFGEDGARRAPTRRSTASASTACSTAKTSAHRALKK